MSEAYDVALQDKKRCNCDGHQLALYEYNFTDWFTNHQASMDEKPFKEKIAFRLSLLDMESSWEVKKVSENAEGRYFSIRRSLHFIPFKETKKWSITIDLWDVFGAKNDVLGAAKQFKGLTANQDKPTIEYKITVFEPKSTPFFDKLSTDYYCKLSISTVICSGLESYLSPTIDFSSTFDGSNVFLDTGHGTPLYFVFELLAVHSSIFYEKFQNKGTLSMLDDHYVIEMEIEEGEFKGLVPVLQMTAYKRNFLNRENIESVALVAKKWKFDMILAACEDFLISSVPCGDIHKLNCLAQHYDMSQLQQEILEQQEKQREDVELPRRRTRGNAPVIIRMEDLTKPTSPMSFLEYITAEKFSIPEVLTEFLAKSTVPLKLNPGERSTQDSSTNAVFEWKIRWSFCPSGRVTLTIQPWFGSRMVFSPKNWSIHVAFTVKLKGIEHKFDVIFTAKKRKETFPIQSKQETVKDVVLYNYSIHFKIKCIKGLRYFVNDSELRLFNTRTPMSTIVLNCSDKKLFANLNILSMASEFFRGVKEHSDMQTIDEEENLPMVNMEDIDSLPMTRILNYVYSINRTPILTRHLDSIIPVADRFLFTGLIRQCEYQLLQGPYHPLEIRTLDYSIKYSLFALRECYLKSFKSLRDIHNLKLDRHYGEISDAAKLLLYEAIMDLPIDGDVPNV